jgi:hypothetical protein
LTGAQATLPSKPVTAVRAIGMKPSAFVVALGLFVGGCARNEPVRTVGPSTYAPLPPKVEVAVFTEANQVKEPYEVIGPISYTDPGKYEMVAVSNAVEPLKAKARAIGGNGIIIDKTAPVKSGIVTTGIAVEARAIRLTGKHP